MQNYGIVDFILTLISLFSIIVIFGQDYAIARFFNHENIKKKQILVISQSLTIHLLQIIFFLPIVYLIIYLLNQKKFISRK